MSDNLSSNKVKGLFGENEASKLLLECGYQILARNFRISRIGEIDIIAWDNDVLCFIEVKTRSQSLYGDPVESVGYRKQKKIQLIAQLYIQQKRLFACEIRFDVIEVFLDAKSQTLKLLSINHIRDAF